MTIFSLNKKCMYGKVFIILQEGVSHWSCSGKLFVNEDQDRIEPAIDESIISSQRIENSSWVLEIWIRFIRFIRRRNISKLATRVMRCNDIDLPLFNRSKPWQKSNLNDLSVVLARKRITCFYFILRCFYTFSGI